MRPSWRFVTPGRDSHCKASVYVLMSAYTMFYKPDQALPPARSRVMSLTQARSNRARHLLNPENSWVQLGNSDLT
jgi:hypothetical protein